MKISWIMMTISLAILCSVDSLILTSPSSTGGILLMLTTWTPWSLILMLVGLYFMKSESKKVRKGYLALCLLVVAISPTCWFTAINIIRFGKVYINPYWTKWQVIYTTVFFVVLVTLIRISGQKPSKHRYYS